MKRQVNIVQSLDFKTEANKGLLLRPFLSLVTCIVILIKKRYLEVLFSLVFLSYILSRPQDISFAFYWIGVPLNVDILSDNTSECTLKIKLNHYIFDRQLYNVNYFRREKARFHKKLISLRLFYISLKIILK